MKGQTASGAKGRNAGKESSLGLKTPPGNHAGKPGAHMQASQAHALRSAGSSRVIKPSRSTNMKRRLSYPPSAPATWHTPLRSKIEHLQDRRPAGVFCLRHRHHKHMYWSTAWDLYEMKREQEDLVRMNMHPDARFNNLADSELAEFVVVREVLLPQAFQLQDFESSLELTLAQELQRMKRVYTERLLQLYKFSRMRVALVLWNAKAKASLCLERGCAALEIQRIARCYVVRQGIKRARELERWMKAQSTAALWCQKHYRGWRDRQEVARAVSDAEAGRRRSERSSKVDRRHDMSRRRPRTSKQQPVVSSEPCTPFTRPCTACHSASLEPVHIEYHPKPRRPALGYISELITQNLRRRAERSAAVTIQRLWRGFHVRRHVKETYRTVWQRRLQRDRSASCIQSWYLGRRQMRDAMDQLVDRRHMKRCSIRVQSAFRGFRTRTQLRAEHGDAIGQTRRAAVACQRAARGFIARRQVQKMRQVRRMFHMAARIADFFREAQRRLKAYREGIFRRQTTAATVIQTYGRRLVARRRVAKMKNQERCNLAAQKIANAWHHHQYHRRSQARSERQLFGSCDFCVSARADLYCESVQQKLCPRCYARSLAVWSSHGVDSHAGRVYDMAEYRRLSFAAGRLQRRFRRFVKWKLKRCGVCRFCGVKPVRLFCLQCRYRTCRTCGAVMHTVNILRDHKLLNIETFKRQKKASYVLTRFFRTYRMKMRLYQRFGRNKQERQADACTSLIKVWRGYKTRRAYAVYSHVAIALMGALHGCPHLYAAWLAYKACMARLPCMFDDDLHAHLFNFTPAFGYGCLTRLVRKRSALAIEGMLFDHLMRRRARDLVASRRRHRRKRGDEERRAVEARVQRRAVAAGTIQRVLRGHRARLEHDMAVRARALSRAVCRQICDVMAIWDKSQETWRTHRGFLGRLTLRADEILCVLTQGGACSFGLRPFGGAFRQPSQRLVGGIARIAVGVRPYEPRPAHVVLQAERAGVDGVMNAVESSVLCLHHTMLPVDLLHEPPSILRIQLAGAIPAAKAQQGPSEEQVSAQRETMPSQRMTWCRVWMCGHLRCSSSNPLPLKTQPAFTDEILYVSLLDCQPTLDAPFLRVELLDSTPAQLNTKVNMSTPYASIELSATHVLQCLGKLTVIDATGPHSPRVALLLSLEDAKRTESRTCVEWALAHVMRRVRHELDARTPRVEVTIRSAAFLTYSCGVAPQAYSGIACVVRGLGQARQSTPMQKGAQNVSFKTTFRLEVPDAYPEEEFRAVMDIVATTSNRKQVRLACARLEHRSLYVPRGATYCLTLTNNDGEAVGRLNLEVDTRCIARPYWRRRLDFCEALVPRLIRKAVSHVPQPRVELMPLEVIGVSTHHQNLVCEVFWRGKSQGILREVDRVTTTAPGVDPARARWTVKFERKTFHLFFAAEHMFENNTPEFYITITGTHPITSISEVVADVRLYCDDILLLPRSRPTQLNLVQRLPPFGSDALKQVTGTFSASFKPMDISQDVFFRLRLPHPHLCVSIIDMRHELGGARRAATFLEGVHCVVIWKEVRVAETVRTHGNVQLTWPHEVFMLPVTSDADNPGISFTIPLRIQVFRTTKSGVDELIGEVTPYSGEPRPVPVTYYPHDVHSVLNDEQEEQGVLGQLGIGSWIEYLDTETSLTQHTSVASSASQSTSADGSKDVDGNNESSVVSSISVSMLKSQAEAEGLYQKAFEAARSKPDDKGLQQHVKLLEKERERAREALAKSAKLAAVEPVNEPPHKQLQHKKRVTMVGGMRQTKGRRDSSTSTNRRTKNQQRASQSSISLQQSSSAKQDADRQQLEDDELSFTDSNSNASASLNVGETAALAISTALLSNPQLSPPVPVILPSVYLRITEARGVSSALNMAPRVGVFWCGKRVGTTRGGSAGPTPQAYVWKDEALLLPVSASKEDVLSLRLEVWSGAVFCGQVVMDEESMRAEYIKLDATKEVRVMEHQLMPRKQQSNKANTLGKLDFSLARLDPTMFEPTRRQVKEAVTDTIAMQVATDGSVLPMHGEIASESDSGKLDALRVTPAELSFISRSYIRRRLIFRLQLLQLHHLPAGGTLESTSRFVVFSLNGRELSRTRTTENTTDPLYGVTDGVVEVPFEWISGAFDKASDAASGAENREQVLQIDVYECKTFTAHEVLGSVKLCPTDLRAMVNVVHDFPLILTKDLTKTQAAASAPSVRFAAHVLLRPPMPSRVELRLQSIEGLVEMEKLGPLQSKPIHLVVVWNGHQVAMIKGSMSSSTVDLKPNTLDLPFDCEGTENLPFWQYPTNLRIELYQGQPRDENRVFMGQLSTCGPYGLPSDDEVKVSLGSGLTTHTFRLTPKPHTLTDPDVPKESIGGWLQCQFVLCGASERAQAWLDALPLIKQGAPHTNIRICGALNLAQADRSPGVNCNPYCIVWFNNRLIHRTAQLNTCFPCWSDEVAHGPLQGNTQSMTTDEVVVEVYHGGSKPQRFLGQVTIRAAQLYKPPTRKCNVVLGKRSFGSTKAQSFVQGTLTLQLHSQSTGAIAEIDRDAPGLRANAETPEAGSEPQTWITMHVIRAEGLQKSDVLAQSSPYCMLLWKRRETFVTSVQSMTTNPSWKQVFKLRYTEDDTANDKELRVMVWHRGVMGADTFLGQVILHEPQLSAGTADLFTLQLQGRADVAEDQRATDPVDRGTIQLRFKLEEELPFKEDLWHMQLGVVGRYAALQIVQLDTDAELTPEGAAEAAAPTFFVQLRCGDEVMGQTACVSADRGEVRLNNEVFILPLSETIDGSSSLRTFDPSRTLQLVAFGRFRDSGHEQQATTTKCAGQVGFDLRDFEDAPAFQTRHTLQNTLSGPMRLRETRMMTSADDAKQLSSLSKTTIVVRRALMTPAVARAVNIDLSNPTAQPRLRLQVFGVCDRRPSDIVMTTRPAQAARYDVKVHFCGGAAQSISVGAVPAPPGLPGTTTPQTVPTFMQAKEFLLPLKSVRELQDVSVYLTVATSGPAAKGTMGQVFLSWEALSNLPDHYFEYKVTELERHSEDDRSRPFLLWSRPVYVETQTSLIDGSKLTSNKISTLHLIYSLRLELPTASAFADSRVKANNSVLKSAEHALQPPKPKPRLRHVTEQGFVLPTTKHDDSALAQRLRVSVIQVGCKYASAAGVDAVRPFRATGLLWLGDDTSTSVVTVPESRRTEPDIAPATCYISLSPDMLKEGPALVVAFGSRNIESASEASKNCTAALAGRVVLSWDNLMRLPMNRTNYLVRSGDEMRYDGCVYEDIEVDALGAVAEEDAGGAARIVQLSGLVVKLRLCLEESVTCRPYMLEVTAVGAEGLAACDSLGSTRIPGLKKRHVYTVTKLDNRLWHVTKAAWSSGIGDDVAISMAGPKAIMPLQQIADGSEVEVSWHDASMYLLHEARAALKIQCNVRGWSARRRVQTVRETRNRAWNQWRAGLVIAHALQRYILRKRRQLAILTLQRACRGFLLRRRVDASIQCSRLNIRLVDLRYVPLVAGAADDMCEFRLLVSWNGKGLKEWSLPVKSATGTPINKDLRVTLKQTLLDESALCHVDNGDDYFLVDRADLSITIIKQQPPEVAVTGKKQTQVARLVLDKRAVKRLCCTVHEQGIYNRKTYHRVDFHVVNDDQTLATILKRKSATFATLQLEKPPPTHPSFVVLGMTLEATLPLWIDPVDHKVHAASPGHSTRNFVRGLLQDVITDAVETSRCRPLDVRVVFVKELGTPTTDVSSLTPSLVVMWEGRVMRTCRLMLDPRKGVWLPNTTSTAKTITLPAAESTDPELTLVLYNEGGTHTQGRSLMASTTLSSEQLSDLRVMTQLRASTQERFKGVEVVLDPCVETGAGTSGFFDKSAPGVIVGIAVHFASSASHGGEASRRRTAKWRKTSVLRAQQPRDGLSTNRSSMSSASRGSFDSASMSLRTSSSRSMRSSSQSLATTCAMPSDDEIEGEAPQHSQADGDRALVRMDTYATLDSPQSSTNSSSSRSTSTVWPHTAEQGLQLVTLSNLYTVDMTPSAPQDLVSAGLGSYDSNQMITASSSSISSSSSSGLWQQRWSEDYQRMYYVNVGSGESRWDIQEIMIRPSVLQARPYDDGTSATSLSVLEAPKQLEYDESRMLYYYINARGNRVYRVPKSKSKVSGQIPV